jgi:hypothetical protein
MARLALDADRRTAERTDNERQEPVRRHAVTLVRWRIWRRSIGGVDSRGADVPFALLAG